MKTINITKQILAIHKQKEQERLDAWSGKGETKRSEAEQKALLERVAKIVALATK